MPCRLQRDLFAQQTFGNVLDDGAFHTPIGIPRRSCAVAIFDDPCKDPELSIPWRRRHRVAYCGELSVLPVGECDRDQITDGPVGLLGLQQLITFCRRAC